jgi:hypothetical protein
MQATLQPEVTRRRFDLLQPYTKRALRHEGIMADAAIALLTDYDLRLFAFLGPRGRADIRRHFPSPQDGEAIPSANGVSLPASRS